MRPSMAIVRPNKPNLAELTAYSALLEDFDLTFFYAGLPEASCQEQLAQIGCAGIRVHRYRTYSDLPLPAVVQKAVDYKLGFASAIIGSLQPILDHEVINIVDPIYYFASQLQRHLRKQHKLVIVRWELIPGRYEDVVVGAAQKQQILARANAVICTTDAALRTLPPLLPNTAVTRIYPGIRDRPVREQPAADGRIIMSIARLGWQKGTGDLIGAVKILREQYGLEIVLELIGSGDITPWRALAERLGVADCVRFAGTLALGEVHARLQACTVYCQPSLTSRTWCEQFGFAVVEAMMAGRPIVAYGSGVLPEVIGPNGLYAPAHNTAVLAEKLADVLRKDDAELATLGLGMRERALHMFDATKQGVELRAFHRNLVA
jgi:glycosyltransferase involved in cell wall biosynthesis